MLVRGSEAKIALDTPFRGERDYVHSTDICTVSPRQVRAVLLGIPSWARAVPNIADDTSFSECDINSLALPELVSEVQRVYDLDIPDDDIGHVSSITNTARYLSDHVQ